jgi:nucleoside-diphosphate-sugar epimerase
MKCLVTGATGFIGRPLVTALLQSGWQVNALSRHGGQVCTGTSAEALDLTTAPVPDMMLAGVEVVFHLAGLAHTQGNPQDYEALNHRATVSLAQQAARLGVRHFIFVSSVKSMGPPPADGCRRAEGDVIRPTDPYGLSKYRAEQALLNEMEAGAMAITVLRPALVYGAAARGNLQLLWRASRWGGLRPPQAGGRSLIALDDLVALLVQIANAAAIGRRCYIVCSEEVCSTRHIYDLMRSARDKRPGVTLLPLGAWRLLCLLRDLVGGKMQGSFDKIFGTELYSAGALASDLGWRPAVPLDDVIGKIASDSA